MSDTGLDQAALSDNEALSDIDTADFGKNDNRLRMRAPVDIDDPKYRGKVVSSKTIFEKEEESDEDQRDSEDDVDDEEDDDDEQGSDDVDEDEQSDTEDRPRAGRSGEDADEVQDIEAEQEADLIRMVSVNPRDRDRAAHARHQRELTDAALELRIRMQKPLALAARLPRGPVLAAFAAHDARAAAAAAAAAVEAVGLLGDLMSLRAALWLQVSIDKDKECKVDISVINIRETYGRILSN